ncbi:MAG: helix-turn-helix transcriptional regulator [Bacteroidaceae bacterium]|nr:helix-turn-helix transcriptional regulator [Bacteroidaceae bacterium]
MPIESMNMLMLNVGKAQLNGDWNWKNVNSPFTRIYYVSEGEAKVKFTDKEVILRPRHLYIIPAYTTHSYECEGHFVHYYLHVYEGFKSEMNVMDFYEFPCEVDAREEEEHIFELLCHRFPVAKLADSNPQTYDNKTQFTDYVKRYKDMELWEKMELRGAILIFFSRFIRKATLRVWTKDERLKKVLTHINRNIEKNIEVKELAELAYVTKSYLIRMFKKEFGTSPIQYINKKKVEKAQLLLLTTDKSIKDVAYTLGYNDHSYFIRMFRKISGTTPQEYRMNLR